MSAHYDGTENSPNPKKAKLDNGNGDYASTETNDVAANSPPHFSVVFSMTDEKGALVGVLQLCKVSTPVYIIVGRYAHFRYLCNSYIACLQQ